LLRNDYPVTMLLVGKMPTIQLMQFIGISRRVASSLKRLQDSGRIHSG